MIEKNYSFRYYLVLVSEGKCLQDWKIQLGT